LAEQTNRTAPGRSGEPGFPNPLTIGDWSCRSDLDSEKRRDAEEIKI